MILEFGLAIPSGFLPVSVGVGYILKDILSSRDSQTRKIRHQKNEVP